MAIYIISPQNRISGGPELAHQLCNAVNRLSDEKAYMCYVNLKEPYNIVENAETPAPYLVYNTESRSNMDEIDRAENIVIFPEGLTFSMMHIKRAKIALWWMSVDNYIVSTQECNVDFIKDNVSLHLFQSKYSIEYVKKMFPDANGIFLSDYINEEHGKFIYPAEGRMNNALYNPAKGFEEIKPLIAKASWLNWIPLVKMDLPHMILTMQSSKIYVDFGNHPGKDRIPREAAADGCVVITNKKGSAAFQEDVPIPEQYKFDDPASQLDAIDTLMHDICDNFVQHQNAFADYRSFIASEKAKFDEDVLNFISVLKTL
ncbi:hypothetical protein [Butyrivibrio hungatei]|uniref:Glycosyl transferase GT4 family n=1 Tax=Butyrivibrio hungatei TaxID=185008 RepID=A0A1D9P3Z4_9FIRM|nr:hypothetical protein [Butyrivibrio hungatei]AOZ97336.1 hypothetical protein bhn_I2303 [Butyrivibrio hungatei]MCR4758152.1 hypothetical protein [Butyrivibrio sp.]